MKVDYHKCNFQFKRGLSQSIYPYHIKRSLKVRSGVILLRQCFQLLLCVTSVRAAIAHRDTKGAQSYPTLCL